MEEHLHDAEWKFSFDDSHAGFYFFTLKNNRRRFSAWLSMGISVANTDLIGAMYFGYHLSGRERDYLVAKAGLTEHHLRGLIQDVGDAVDYFYT